MKLIIFFLGMALFASSAKADILSPRAFTEAAAAAAKAVIPSATVTVTGDLQLQTRSSSGETTSTDLRNAYEIYRRDPSNLDDVIRRYVGVLAETVRLGDSKAVLDRSRIVPVLKSNKWVEGVRRAQNKAAGELLTEPFNSELTIVYAEDRPQSLRFLTTREDVGDRKKLHDAAIANLEHILPKIQLEAGGNGNFLIRAGGSYEASLLLVDGLWSSGQIKVDGDIVAAVPARDVLLITGSRNEASVARLRELAVKFATGPYALTPALFVYRGGRFVLFQWALTFSSMHMALQTKTDRRYRYGLMASGQFYLADPGVRARDEGSVNGWRMGRSGYLFALPWHEGKESKSSPELSQATPG